METDIWFLHPRPRFRSMKASLQVFTTPDNQHLFVGLGTGGVDAFALNAGSALVQNRVHIASLQPGANRDTAITGDNTSRYLYVAESGAGIRVLTINGGSFANVPGSPFGPQLGAPSSLIVDPANSALYAVYSRSNLIAGYAIGSDGALTAVSRTPFSTTGSPTALSLDASGRYLVALAGGVAPGAQVFSFSETAPGNLQPLSGT